MKRVLMVGLLALAAGSIYSSVYACDHSRKNVATTAEPQTKTIRTVVVDATTGCKLMDKSDKSRVMTFDFQVDSKDAPRFVQRIEHRAEVESPSPIRTAVTLGKAFVTTIGAVASSLMGLFSGFTAGLV
ncbi:MAG TPA: hypothetical protein VFH33_07645 [Candidatus Krumholzibacteria bacterium]|nr:hypothetical protein [Candidatus Krumholzibacteria bacterium]